MPECRGYPIEITSFPTIPMTSIFTTITVLVLALTTVTGFAVAGETCVERNGLEVCVQSRGPCDLSRIMPRELEGLKMEMLLVEISNGSDRRVRIDPANFMGITEGGQAIQLDWELFESIELKTKLRKADLAPGGQLKGHLFFPAWEGRLRTVVHRGQPTFQIWLY